MASLDHEEMFQDDDAMADDAMNGSAQEDEDGEGDVVMPDATDDSSEEGEEDSDDLRKVHEGFIVDEDDEEEEDQEEEKRRKRRKRRKKGHRNAMLEDDDLDLLEENTGGAFKRNRRLVRKRNRDSESPPAASSSRRRAVIESSEDDLDNEEDMRRAPDIQNIWDDDRRGDEDDGDMSSFIEYSDEEEGMAMNEEAREARRKEKRQEQLKRKQARGARPELVGIDANAWDEIHDVFGDGHDYDWALALDDEVDEDHEVYKPPVKYDEVFEPSEIRNRWLTEDDDLIRGQDIPERMQLSTSSLSQSSSLSTHRPLEDADLPDASIWVTRRISNSKLSDYLDEDGQYHSLQAQLVEAVTFTLRQLFVEEYEVPYIWAHKRDYITHFDPKRTPARHELLTQDELWRIYTLGLRFRSILERRRVALAFKTKLGVEDEYFDKEIVPRMDNAEVIADATEYLNMKYKDKKNDVNNDFRFHDDEEHELTKKRKMPSRVSAYELAKRSIVSKIALGFGIEPHQVASNFDVGRQVHFVDDQELSPVAFAEQFVDPDPSKASTPEELLRRARMIVATELGKDPILRMHMRSLFRDEARVTVEPTDKGVQKIDDTHPYFSFKYLNEKPLSEMKESAQFLQILAAENEHLVTVSITIPPEAKAAFEARLSRAFSSDSFNESAKAWNVERSTVIQDVLNNHLIPAAVKWAREYVREEAEDYLAHRCGERLRARVNSAPYLRRELRLGEIASSVLAISWGKGDPHKDAITLVFVDEGGRMREHTKIDNLHDGENQDEFADFVRRRKPDVAVVGGFSIATLKLMHRIKEIFRGSNPEGQVTNEQAFDIPAIYVHDDIARMYQHSKRAAEEFSALSLTAKYCVGLARYVQSPLNEFAALGRDIAAITFDDEFQNFVPREKLLTVFERVLVDVTNKVGVDINRAVMDTYYRCLLPFVCGLGPRKAQLLVNKIAAQGGTLVNRDQFIKSGLLTTKIFLNAAGFLRILQERESRHSKYRPDDENAPDPLDDTRIHPEDYELARKMATDALELDEEDIHDEHPSHVVTLIMQDREKERKLAELNLDEFAVSLYEANQDRKRHTLNVIREELIRPFAEKRSKFQLPSDWDIITMLTGETAKTLKTGLIISAQVYRIQKDMINVRLDSGIEGIIPPHGITEESRQKLRKGHTVRAVIIEHKPQLEHDLFHVELTSLVDDLAPDDKEFWKVRPDQYWNETRFMKDRDILARKKRAEADRSRRVIKHPNFHNFNTVQAETYLEKQQRGDVVIRPSSKGSDHLAVTWKVDDGLYQHIDVTETNVDPTGQSVGGQLVVDPTHAYSDLDELIVNHVQAMARRVEELMAHEKFKHGTEDDLHLSLKNFLAANPAKSMYGFCLNRKKPGHFNLCFLANKNSPVQTWPVRVAPEAYYLFDAAAGGVPELCDAFKVRHLHESQNMAAAAGGKTPFGAGMRTPARPGGATPGHMSIRHAAPPVGRTPNPYAIPGQGPPPFHPGMAPFPGATPQTYGYQTPAHRPPYGAGPPPPMPPPSMHHPLPPGMNPPPPRVWGYPS